jgi:hypothetical protein
MEGHARDSYLSSLYMCGLAHNCRSRLRALLSAYIYLFILREDERQQELVSLGIGL